MLPRALPRPPEGRFAVGRPPEGRFAVGRPPEGRLALGLPPEGRCPALGRPPEGRCPALGRWPGFCPAPGRCPAAGRWSGRRTCWPPLPRQSMRFWTPPRRLLFPIFCRTLLLLYLTPWRCSGLCCQLLPPKGLTRGRLMLMLLLFQLHPPPQ